LNLPIQRAGDVHPGDFLQGFDLVLEMVGILLELDQPDIPGKVDEQDGDFGQVDPGNLGLLEEVQGQLWTGVVDRLLDIQVGLGIVDRYLELDEDRGVVLDGVARDFLNSVYALELLFDGPG
jgi:hypothetical protein